VSATSLLSATSVFGSELLARIGVGLAVFGGLLACLLAWREARQAQRLAAAQSLKDLRINGAKLHDEREQHRRVLQVLQERNSDLRHRLNETRAEAASLAHEVSTLRGDNAALRIEMARIQAEDSVHAEVVSMPRRVSGQSVDGEDLWNEGNVPTVVDLQSLSAPFVEEVLRQHA